MAVDPPPQRPFEAMATMIEHRLRRAKAVELVNDGRAGVCGP
jgi:hypothetical protein